MSCSATPSHYLVELRDKIKPHVHGGKFFAGEELAALCRRLNTIIALSEEVESEKDALERELRCIGRRVHPPALVGGNVFPFPKPEPPNGGAA